MSGDKKKLADDALNGLLETVPTGGPTQSHASSAMIL
jgi:hypothetical protein